LSSFTKIYNATILFYYEEFDQYRDAFKRKTIKKLAKTAIEVYKTKQSRIKRFIFEFINVAQDEILK
jgi:predicted GIY-YIG superfamily endonuclease